MDTFVYADTKYIKMFVLDEADEMLSRGFKDQIYDVFRTLDENIQVTSILRFLCWLNPQKHLADMLCCLRSSVG